MHFIIFCFPFVFFRYYLHFLSSSHTALLFSFLYTTSFYSISLFLFNYLTSLLPSIVPSSAFTNYLTIILSTRQHLRFSFSSFLPFSPFFLPSHSPFLPRFLRSPLSIPSPLHRPTLCLPACLPTYLRTWPALRMIKFLMELIMIAN